MKHNFCSLASALFLVAAAVAGPEPAPRLESAEAPPIAAPESGPVFVIPIKDMIERGLVYFVERGLQEADRNGCTAVILDMDTPGGRLDATEDIIRMLTSQTVKTYTFVHDNAISAGAIIALATDAIYMTPGGVIGDAMPIMMSPLPFGGPQALPDDLKEKMMSPTAALIRSVAQRKGHDQELAEAMVRPDKEYKIGEKTICEKGKILTLTSREAEMIVGEGESSRPLLSSGTVNTIEELLVKIGRPGARIVTVKVSPAESLARFIGSFPMSGIILALGLLGLYIEFKTPGFGLPGIAGIVLLALWFWGHHIAGLAGMEELLIFLAGVVLLVVEVFFIPGFGITGILGLILIFGSILMAMVEHLPGRPIYVVPEDQIVAAVWKLGLGLICLVAGAWGLGKLLPRTSVFRRVALGTELHRAGGYAASANSDDFAGRRGFAGTALRPAGIGVFGAKRVNVVSRGEFIEQGTPIVVAETHGSRIVVEPFSEKTAGA